MILLIAEAIQRFVPTREAWDSRSMEREFGPVLVIDVSHPPLPQRAVEEWLLAAWEKIRNSSRLRILKVVHGYGSTGKGGSTRLLVRNWAYRHQSRFKGIIEGENYSIFSNPVQEMRAETGQHDDPDLHAPNQGVTIIWVK